MKGILITLLSILIIIIPLSLPIPTNSAVNPEVKNLSYSFKRFNPIITPFIQNNGQFHQKVAFLSRNALSNIVVTKDGKILYDFHRIEKDKNSKKIAGLVIEESLIGANLIKIQGSKVSESRVSYFKGKYSENWIKGIETYEEISFGEIYNGIEFRLKATGDNIEKLFYLRPDADVRNIRIKVKGVENIELLERGELVLKTKYGQIKFTKPKAFQFEDGKDVEVNYAKISKNVYGFSLGNYDKSKTVVIDPLLSSTFLGGRGSDWIKSVKLDNSGNVYVVGETSSDNFPIKPGAYSTQNRGNFDVFVAKLSGDLRTLLASTFIGGSKKDYAYSIEIDKSGNIYVAGSTDSTDFPTTNGAYKRNFSGGDSDVFIVKLNNDLTNLLASTYLGGSRNDAIFYVAMKVDDSGYVYLGGATTSSDFPTTSGAYDRTFRSETIYNPMSFVAKMNNNLSQLVASTFVGGKGNDIVFSIDIDKSSNQIYVAGGTDSDDFPTTPNVFQRELKKGRIDNVILIRSSGFIAKFNSDLSTLIASTFFGGSGDDSIYDVILKDGIIYFGGVTESSDLPITSNAYDRTYGGESDHFVAKMSSDLRTLIASTYLGGSGRERAVSIKLDISGNVYLVGQTNSTDFPTTDNAIYRSYRGGKYDAYIAKLNNSLSQLLASTYLGGSGEEKFAHGSWVYINSAGIIYVVGNTESSDFPVTSGTFSQTYGGYTDAFICRISFDTACVPPFQDVPCDHWAVSNIQWIKDRGITTGYPDGTFRPEASVKRSEMAAFIIRALEGESFSYPSTPYFTDVTPGMWHFKYVQRLRQRGLTTGCNSEGTMYCPEGTVTRAQMAAFLVRAKVGESFSYSTTPYFSDVPSTHWAFRYIQKLKELGITTGYGDGRYGPEDPVTRAQMATFLYRAFGR